MELFLDVLGETLVDTAKMLPFLFLAYLLIEYIEHRHGERIEALLAGGGRWGAVPGAVLGCVPQCGFSAIASNFYASRVITLGTLMAVYLATSDEAIPLLVSMPAYWDKLAVLMVIKVVYAIVVGFVLDFVLRGVLPKGLRGGKRPLVCRAVDECVQSSFFVAFPTEFICNRIDFVNVEIHRLPRLEMLCDHVYIAVEIHRVKVADYLLLRYSSIAFAAALPAPIAEITVAAPVTASPPA